MKTLTLFLIVTASIGTLLAAEESKQTTASTSTKEFETLVTTKGKSYTKVKIREVTPSGVKIFHEAGAATIPYEELPEEIQKNLGGFDPEAAQKHRTKENKDLRAQENALDKELIETQQQEKEKKFEKVLDGVKLPTKIDIKQMNDGGALCTVSFKVKTKIQNKVARPLGGYDIKEEEKWVWTSYSEEWYFVAGLPNNLVDGDSWEGWTLPSGSFPYTNALGARKTVRKLDVANSPQKQ